MKQDPLLKTLRKLTGVQSVKLIDGRLWVRFEPGATSDQRDAVTMAVTGKRPVIVTPGLHDLTPPKQVAGLHRTRTTGCAA